MKKNVLTTSNSDVQDGSSETSRSPRQPRQKAGMSRNVSLRTGIKAGTSNNPYANFTGDDWFYFEDSPAR